MSLIFFLFFIFFFFIPSIHAIHDASSGFSSLQPHIRHFIVMSFLFIIIYLVNTLFGFFGISFFFISSAFLSYYRISQFVNAISDVFIDLIKSNFIFILDTIGIAEKFVKHITQKIGKFVYSLFE